MLEGEEKLKLKETDLWSFLDFNLEP